MGYGYKLVYRTFNLPEILVTSQIHRQSGMTANLYKRIFMCECDGCRRGKSPVYFRI